MGIIWWIIFGFLIGTISNIIDPYPSKRGFLGSAVLGISGAILGGVIASMIFGIGILSFDFVSISIAVLGSLMLLFMGRIINPDY